MLSDFSKILNKNNDNKESIDFEEIFKSFLFKKKLAITIFIFSFASINVISYVQRKFNPIYMGSFSILIKDPISSEDNALQGLNQGINLSSVASMNSTSSIPTLISYLKSEVILNDLSSKFSIPVGELSSKIEISKGGPKNNAKGILNINFKINNPQKGEKILKNLSETYIKSSLIYRQKKLEDGIRFISNEKPDYENKINLATQRINRFKEKYEFIKDDQKDGIKIINLVKRDNLLTSKIKNIESRNNLIKTKKFKNKFNELEKNNSKIKYLKNLLNETNSEFKNPTALFKEINDLEKEVFIYENAINRLTALSENYRLEIAQKIIPWRIISPPKMGFEPINKFLLKEIIISFGISLLFSSLAVFISLRLKNIFKDPQEIEKYINLYNLGIIDNSKNNLSYKNSLEEFCITLMQLKKQKEINSFFIASAIEKEGKTTINTSVSRYFANLNEKTLLIDTNFRSPKIHSFFNLDSAPGISDFVLNDNEKIENIINKTDNVNLDVICASNFNNEKNLLSGYKKILAMIKKLEKTYSYIFIDGPSINNYSEALFNCQFADATILLISTKFVKKDSIDQCFNKLAKSGAKIEGILINKK